MELKKTGSGLDNFLKRIKSLENDEVEIGWFVEQGYHHSGLTYPDLARVHFNGVSVPRRDILGLALFLYNPATDIKLKKKIRQWIKSTDDETELYKAIGRLERNNIKDTFGNPQLKITNNPTPLIDTGEWKNATAFKLKSEGKVRKR